VFRLAADAVVLLHLAFIAFILLGGFLALRWPWVALIHLPLAIWGVLVQWMSWICPLTPLENSLRSLAGAPRYEGGFVEHYILPALYPAGMGPQLHIVLGAVVLGANAVSYGMLLFRLLSQRRVARRLD
jgi:hypothetical protein